ncbi:MAG: phytanoyl-CoA dioxygenase family protein [Planctomycetota bacterium]|nr:phytanoyl-CoA dioxygenase family protein [Planctomycetota bacterium]
MPVLSPAEIEQFVDDGYVVVRKAFPRDLAELILPDVWAAMGYDAHKPETWDKAFIHLRQFLWHMPFEAVYTEKLRGAVDQLLGRGRWLVPMRSGWWPIYFPGHQKPPWKAPESGWHVDGGHQHHLNSPEQGLLGILIFSEIRPGDGGTAISLGSHLEAARFLAAAEPEGLKPGEISQKVAALPRPRVLEITGEPGDVALMHPLMLHSASPNTGPRVRILTNKTFPLRKPMDLSRANPAEQSPVERAILKATSAAQATR